MSDLIEFACPHCNHLYQLNAAQMAKYGGKTIRCKNCQQKFQAPEAEGHGGGDQPASSDAPAVEQPAPETYAEAPARPEAPAPMVLPAPPQQYAPQPQQYAPQQGLVPIQYQPYSTGAPPLVQILLFKKNLTPICVQIVFWTSVGLSLLAVFEAFSELSEPMVRATVPIGFVLIYLLMCVIFPVVVRILCELAMNVLRIHDSTLDQQSRRNQP